ncbi:MAG TPA: adhesin, partial [Solibacillus sp.]
MKKWILLIPIVTLLLAACNATNDKAVSTQSDDKLSIYTTVYPLQYFTQRIGGDFVEVTSIYPA